MAIVEGYSWWEAVLALTAVQVGWSIFTYTTKYVNVWLAGIGVWVAMLRWIACPVAAYELYALDEIGLAIFALFWPLLLHIVKAPLWPVMGIAFGLLSKIEFAQIGFFQTLFMQKLGYTRREESDNSSSGT